MPRPTTAPATAMAAMVDTAVVFTDTARGPLMPRPTTVPATAMAAMVDTAAVATDTARGPLMPRLTTAMVAVMAATVTAVDTPGASKSLLVKGLAMLLLTSNDTHRNQAKIFRP